MKLVLPIFLMLLLAGCGVSEKVMHEGAKTYEGTLLKEQYKTKKGKTIEGAYDYFMVIEGTKWYVNVIESDVSKEDLDKIVDKKVRIQGLKEDGIWDTDIKKAHSRYGPYVAIFEIMTTLE